MAILGGFLLVTFIISAVLLVIIVLMQDEQSDGLCGIFGGNAAPVGNRSGNILTRITSIIAIVFLTSLFGYAWIHRTPEGSNVEAAARALETGEGEVLEWWRVEEPVNIPDDITLPETVIESDESESATDGESEQ